MPSRPVNSRLDDLMSWFAGSVLVTAGVIYTLKLRDGPHEPAPAAVPPRATPAQEPLTLQELRADERGRGRRARKPLQLPWRGWKDVLVRTYREIQDDRLLALAAGVTFYSLVALFPAIAAGVSCYALFANAATIGNHLSIAADIIPASTLDIMGTEISRIAAKSDGRLTFGFILGLGIALWSANAGMKAIFDALNHHLRRRGKARPRLAQRGLAVLHDLRHRRSRTGDRARGGIPARSGGIRRHELRPSDHRISALALDVRADHPGAFPALPLRAEPPAGALALD